MHLDSESAQRYSGRLLELGNTNRYLLCEILPIVSMYPHVEGVRRFVLENASSTDENVRRCALINLGKLAQNYDDDSDCLQEEYNFLIQNLNEDNAIGVACAMALKYYGNCSDIADILWNCYEECSNNKTKKKYILLSLAGVDKSIRTVEEIETQLDFDNQEPVNNYEYMEALGEMGAVAKNAIDSLLKFTDSAIYDERTVYMASKSIISILSVTDRDEAL